jgi:hypothetical protein
VRSAARPSADAARAVAGGAIGSGTLLAGRYLLKQHLGAGRFAEIYLAVDQAFSSPELKQERQVALHLVHRHVEKRTSMLKRLQQAHHEPQSWAHRSLIRVRNFGNDRGRYYFVTERLQGASLRTILDDTPEELMSENEALAVLRAVGDGLKYAHAKGAVHGDLRPENVFITHEYAIKVLDLWPEMPTRGAPFFIEDVESSQPPDPRDDVYGLASLAYEMFAGHHPFNGNSPIEAAAANLPLVPISRLTVNRWAALERALALRRSERTPSVQQFLDELGITGDERLRPPETDPPPPTLIDEVAVPAPSGYREEPAVGRVAAYPPREYSRDAMLIPEPVVRRPERGAPSGSWAVLVLALVIAGAGAVAAYRTIPAFQTRADNWYVTAQAAAEDLRQTLKARLDRATATSAPSAARPAAPTAAPAPEATPPSAAVVVPPAPPAANLPSPVPAVADPSSSRDVTATPPQAPAVEPDAPAPAAIERPRPDVPPTPAAVRPETLSVASNSIVVAESQAGAVVEITRRGGDLDESSIVWWTTGGTAIADEDYAGLGARIEQFPKGVSTLRLLVPLIGDASPEPDESFYVHARSAGSSAPRRVAAPELIVEVVIRDDD